MNNTVNDKINNTYYPNHTDYITFIEKYNKTYNFNNYLEYHKNVEYVEHMNKGKNTYELELNKFAELTAQSRDFRYLSVTLGTRTLGIAISDEEISEYYENNPDAFIEE